MKRISVFTCVVLLAITMLVVLGCGGNSISTAGMSPTQVVDKYMQASLQRDADTVYGLLSSADKENISLDEARKVAILDFPEYEITYKLGEETINGDEAMVEVTVTFKDVSTGESDDLDESLDLAKEDGEWKIYLGDSL